MSVTVTLSGNTDPASTSDIISLDLRLTDGEPCDSAELELIHSDSLANAALSCQRVLVSDEDGPIFTGVPDEISLKLTQQGSRLCISARGLAALMMQRECEGAQFVLAAMEDILSKYVFPCGITDVDCGSLPALPLFSVNSGETCWGALCDYAAWSAGIRPRFSPSGTLILREDGYGGKRLRVDSSLPVISAELTRKSYGVISSCTVRERTSGRTLTHSDSSLVSQGISANAVMTAPNGYLSAYLPRARALVEESARGFVTASITLAEPFAMSPGDSVELALPGGISGSFIVSEARTLLGPSGGSSVCGLVRL